MAAQRAIVAGMNSSNLTRDQARALKNKIGPMLGYLSRLNQRMMFKGFPPDDPLLALVVKAENALHELHVAMHYLALDGCLQPTRPDID